MLNFYYFCHMRKKTTIDIIGESERTTLYSIKIINALLPHCK